MSEPTAGQTPTCRICLEEGGGPMISPCACTGTQKYVHVACLQRWRMSADSGRGLQRRRTICPVCRHAYNSSALLPEQPRRADRHAGHSSLRLLAAAIAGLGAALCAAPRGLAMLALPVLFGWCALQTGAFGVRMALAVDDDGVPLLRMIRTGAPVQGLAAGTLLVSTEAIGGGIFYRSVLLITRYSRDTGTIGYIINMPVGEQGRAELRHALNVEGAPGIITHGVGGPVAMAEWQVLHGFEGIDGATEVAEGCFVGGELAQIQAAACAAWRELAARQNRGQPERPPVLVQVVYGHAAWAPGQLEGEMRHGAWKWAEGLGPSFVRDADHETAYHRALAIAVAAWNHQGGATAPPGHAGGLLGRGFA